MVVDELAVVLAFLRTTATYGQQRAPAGAGWRYGSWAALVLDRGRVFTPAAVDADRVPATWRGAPSTCYACAAAWSTGAGLPYVEGWAASKLLTMGTPHAWCAGRDGEALDPTWSPGYGTVYVGLAVTAAYRARVPAPRLLSEDNPAGLALLRDGVADDVGVDVGRPIPPGRTLLDIVGADDRGEPRP